MYRAIEIDEIRGRELQRLLNMEVVDFENEGILQDSELFRSYVIFPDGMQIEIAVHSGQTNLWVDSILLNEEGIEVGCNEPEFDLIGEYHFRYNGTDYVVNINLADSTRSMDERLN